MLSTPESIVAGKYPLEKYHIIGYNETNGLFARGVEFDALFCLTDSMAMGAIRSLARTRQKNSRGRCRHRLR